MLGTPLPVRVGLACSYCNCYATVTELGQYPVNGP